MREEREGGRVDNRHPQREPRAQSGSVPRAKVTFVWSGISRYTYDYAVFTNRELD